MKNVRYLISKYCIYIFLFCALFLIQRFILLFFFDLKKYVIFNKIYVYEIVLSLVSYLEVKHCVKISRPE